LNVREPEPQKLVGIEFDSEIPAPHAPLLSDLADAPGAPGRLLEPPAHFVHMRPSSYLDVEAAAAESTA